MKALQLVAWQAEPEFREVPVPEPGPGEVLLRVAAAGLCHSDLHVMDWPEGTLPYSLPFTLGHENAGFVAKLGGGVTGYAEGDPVLVYGAWGCGRCWSCRSGSENLCERGGLGGVAGLGVDGGLAEYLLLPSSRFLLPLGELDPVDAAPLADAALTPYHAIKGALPLLRPGAAAVVIGSGGLGHVAVQVLKAVSSVRVIALDIREEALQLARDSGADAAISSVGLDPRTLRDELPRGRAAVVLDFVGSDATLELCRRLVAIGGHVAIVGAGDGTIAMGFSTFPPGVTITHPRWGTIPDLQEVIALARAGLIEMRVEPFALEQAPEAYKRLRRGTLRGRAVVAMRG